MKLRLFALSLLLMLLLSACSGMLNRSYSNEKQHSQFTDEDKNSNTLRADTYEGLISALLYLINNGEESGIIRLYNYGDTAEKDLDAACLEATQQDPLGAYAVDYMKYDMARLGTYDEVELKIFYKRSWQQISAVSSVTGSSALLGELRAALSEFQKEKVLRVGYFDPAMQADSVAAMLAEVYYDVPESAFGKPMATIKLYPEEASGQQRLVEILLEYPEPRELLREKQKALLDKSADLIKVWEEKSATQKVLGVIACLQNTVKRSEAAPGTPYAALIDGEANAEGVTLAAELLLQKSDLQCRVVRGTKQGQAHMWLMVQMEDVWQHLDLTLEKPMTKGDGEMRKQNYDWSGDFPLCRDL